MGRVSEEDVKVLSRVLSSLPGGLRISMARHGAALSASIPGNADKCPRRWKRTGTSASSCNGP